MRVKPSPFPAFFSQPSGATTFEGFYGLAQILLGFLPVAFLP